jgi:23S rRNA pseudouridine1911/1915/1917 synthase
VTQRIQRQAIIPETAAGERLDVALAGLFPEFSRARLQRWLKAGDLTVDGASPRGRTAVAGGEAVVIDARQADEGAVLPEPIPLDVIHEDAAIAVINKPAGLVVHPGAGNPAGTLQNALLHHDPALAGVPRSGIVHRLDRETSGLMVVAKTLEAHTALVDQLQARAMGREYLALVVGTFTGGGKVDAPIGRHPRDRLKMAVRASDGKPAVTHYRVEARFIAHTLLRCRLETGRTHQIRVHMAHIRHPIVGDPVYGGRLRLPGGAEAVTIEPPAAVAEAGEGEPPAAGPMTDAYAASAVSVADVLRGFRRQALHAETLTLDHPVTGERCTWTTPVPADFARLRDALDRHQAHYR